MKIIFQLSILFFSTLAIGQVTVNQHPDVDSKFILGDLNYAEVNFGTQIKPTGGNQIWKFDSISLGGSIDTVFFLDPKVLTISKNIPEANLLVYNDYRALFPFSFYKVDSKEQNLIGISDDGVSLSKLDNPFLFNKFPLSFQNEFEGQTTFNYNIIKIEMENFNKVDGWGEIQTPNGSFPCLRTKTVTTLLGSLAGKPYLSYTIEEYRWLSPGYDYDVFSYTVSETEVDEDLSNDTLALYLVNQIISSTKEEAQSKLNINVSPNPSRDLVNITIPENGNNKLYKIEIYDEEAKLIYQSEERGNSTVIPVSNWTRGTYMVKVSLGLKTWGLKKLILE
ncbi:MAG: T9SS type A sorting domain-containing protein [Saprospiraceae bacterium]